MSIPKLALLDGGCCEGTARTSAVPFYMYGQGLIVLCPQRTTRVVVVEQWNGYRAHLVKGARAIATAECPTADMAIATIVMLSVHHGYINPSYAAATRIGVSVHGNLFGAFASIPHGEVRLPVLAVDNRGRRAIANLRSGQKWFEGSTPLEAMLRATSALLAEQ